MAREMKRPARDGSEKVDSESPSIVSQLAGATRFPLREGSKIPACKWQEQDLPEVRDGQNYGIHTGKSGLIVVDLDKHETDGVEAFEKMLPDGVWPETFTVETPSGGLHLYFKATDDIGRHPNLLGKGIDVLGGEGYVVGPGSRVDGKEYRVVKDTDIQDLPQWLKLRITGVIGSGWASDREGQDDKLSKAVFRMRLDGTSKEDAYAKWLKLVEDTGGTKDPSRPWQVSDFERHWKGADKKVSEKETTTAPSTALAVREPEKLPELASAMGGYLNVKTLAELDDTPLSYRVDGILPLKSNVLFSAYRKSGKTSTVLGLVNAMTSHADFIGRPCTTVSGKVFYVNFEMDEVLLRTYALDGCGIQLGREKLSIAQMRGKAGKFAVLDDDFALLFAQYLKDTDCEVLVVDPLSAILSSMGIDEWNNPVNRQILERFSAIAEMAGVDNMIIVDHAGHENKGRSRGASSKEDWADVLWVLDKRTDGTRTLAVEGRGVDETKIAFTRDPDTKELIESSPVDADDAGRSMLMSIITATPGINSQELADKALMTKQAVSQRTRMLKDAGLITIEPHRGTKPARYYPVEGLVSSVSSVF